MKKRNGFLIITCLFSMSSCVKDTTQIIIEEFNKYHDGIEDVVWRDYDELHFENHVLKIFEKIDGIKWDSINFFNDRIYYFDTLTLDSYNKINSLQFYSCDFNGNNIELLHEEQINSDSKIDYKVVSQMYYFEYKVDDIKYIDTYNIVENEYKNIACGKKVVLEDYIEEEVNEYDYKVVDLNEKDSFQSIKPQSFDYFEIIHKESGISKKIDDEYLKSTIYFESLEKFSYNPKRVDISSGHILLIYGIGGGNGWTYPNVIFEYNFDTEKLEFKLLIFPLDYINFEIIYIDK